VKSSGVGVLCGRGRAEIQIPGENQIQGDVKSSWAGYSGDSQENLGVVTGRREFCCEGECGTFFFAGHSYAYA